MEYYVAIFKQNSKLEIRSVKADSIDSAKEKIVDLFNVQPCLIKSSDGKKYACIVRDATTDTFFPMLFSTTSLIKDPVDTAIAMSVLNNVELATQPSTIEDELLINPF